MDRVGTHLPLLTYILSLTDNGRCIAEFGMGDYSSPFLKIFSDNNDLTVYSYETNDEWMIKYTGYESKRYHMKHVNVKNIDEELEKLKKKNPSVVFIDTGKFSDNDTRRNDVLHSLIDVADYIICHDTEVPYYGYNFQGIKYRNDHTIYGVRTTILSNKVDVTNLSLQDI